MPDKIPCNSCRIEYRCPMKTMYQDSIKNRGFHECPFYEEERRCERGTYND